MEKLTQKEKTCLLEYTSELKQLMEEENLILISDNQYSYTRKELDELSRKVKKIND